LILRSVYALLDTAIRFLQTPATLGPSRALGGGFYGPVHFS